MPPYPKPSAMGGTLIRKVIAQFKAQSFSLPITEPVLIAVSGGVDSMVLGHLLARFGRRIVSPEFITFLHIDHGWRKESGSIEKKSVHKLAESLHVKFISEKFSSPGDAGQSGSKKNHVALSKNKEEDARLRRLELFERLAGSSIQSPSKPYRYVFTAHHEGDVVETLFFRFLRGEFHEQGEGILFQDPPLLRPFLKVTKEEIYEYAKAEKIPFHEDPSNEDTSKFRALMRLEIFPKLLKHMPGLKSTLSRYAAREVMSVASSKTDFLFATIEGAILAPLNRVQRNEIAEMVSHLKVGACLTLAGGIKIKRLKNGFFIEILDRPIRS